MDNFSCTDVRVHQGKIRETPSAGDDPNQEQDPDVAMQKAFDDPRETPSGPLEHDQSDEEFEIVVEDDVLKCMEAAEVKTRHEEVNPATVQDLKDRSLQDKSSENSEAEEYMDCQQNAMAPDVNSKENKSMNLGEEGSVPRAEKGVLCAVTTQETQKHPLDVNEPKHGQNMMPSEPSKQNQDRVKAPAVHRARKPFPGQAKREHNLEEAVECHETQGQQDDYYDARGFDCYDPEELIQRYNQSPGTTRRRYQEEIEQKKRLQSNANGSQWYQEDGQRYEEEKKHRAGWGLTNPFATLFSSPGNRRQPGRVLYPQQQASSNYSSAGGASYHRGGSNLAGGSNVYTLNDLPVPTPFLQCGLVHMKLKKRAKGDVPDEPEPEAVKEAKAGIEGIFIESSESNLKLEESYEQEAMDQHEKQLDEIFEGIHEKIEVLRIDVKKKFRTLTLEQQKQVLKFWLMVEEFLEVLLKYIRTRFDDVLVRIRRGNKIDRQAIKKIFNYVIEFLKAIF